MTASRALQAVSLLCMGLLLALIVLLIAAYTFSSSTDPLLGITLVMAAALAIPLVTSLVLWLGGVALRPRSPRFSLALIGSSAAVSSLAVVITIVAYLPA